MLDPSRLASTARVLTTTTLLLSLGWLCGCPPQLASTPAPRLEAPAAQAPAAPAAAPAAPLPRTQDGSEPATVLIMTNPIAPRVEDFLNLVRRGHFKVPGLRLLGIYPKGAAAKFAPTHELIERLRLGCVELRELECEIPQEQIFKPNPCLETFRGLVAASHGILLNGGPDIPPAIYGEETLLTTVIVDPPRHAMELSFLHHLLAPVERDAAGFAAARPDYFVFGICLGMQTLSVALGGTMHQDVPSELYGAASKEDVLEHPESKRHRNYRYQLDPIARPDYWVLHSLTLKPGWPFAAAEGAPPRVISAHHQAVEKLGRELEVIATSVDGKVIEAVKHRRFPNVFGVQFHPEYRMIYEVSGAAAESPPATEGAPDDPTVAAFHAGLWGVLAEKLKSSAAASRPAP